MGQEIFLFDPGQGTCPGKSAECSSEACGGEASGPRSIWERARADGDDKAAKGECLGQSRSRRRRRSVCAATRNMPEGGGSESNFLRRTTRRVSSPARWHARCTRTRAAMSGLSPQVGSKKPTSSRGARTLSPPSQAAAFCRLHVGPHARALAKNLERAPGAGPLPAAAAALLDLVTAQVAQAGDRTQEDRSGSTS